MRFKWNRAKGYPKSIDLLDLDIDRKDFENARVGWVEPRKTMTMSRQKYHAYVLWGTDDIERINFDSLRAAMRALRLAYRVYRMGGGMYKKRTT